MTRINLVNPADLTDKHLLAELRELPRIFSYVEKHGIPENLPTQYVLGKGHMKFFTDKLTWLFSRWCVLRREWVDIRGFKYELTPNDINRKYGHLFAKEQATEYIPTNYEISLNVERINNRLQKTGEIV